MAQIPILVIPSLTESLAFGLTGDLWRTRGERCVGSRSAAQMRGLTRAAHHRLTTLDRPHWWNSKFNP
jgi:hypothetical protein